MFSNLNNTTLYCLYHISISIHHPDRLFPHPGSCANATVGMEMWFHCFGVMTSFILDSCPDRFVES